MSTLEARLARVEKLLCIFDSASNSPTTQQIQRFVAYAHSMEVEEMLSRARPTHIVEPRQIAMALCREFTTLSLDSIGKRFNGRDHGTVCHAIDVIADRVRYEPAFRTRFQALRQALVEALNRGTQAQPQPAV